MLGNKLQNLLLCALPLFFLGSQLRAEEIVNDTAPSPLETTEAPLEAPKMRTKAEQIASNFVISSGFGYIRAYREGFTGNLGATGTADVKLSYLLPPQRFLRNKKVYTTLHYLPFFVGPNITINGVYQEYRGVVSIYTGGGEVNVYSDKHIDVFASLEAGLFHSSLTEYIPVNESEKPIKRVGGVVIGGAEVRYKPLEQFHTGVRLYLGGGSFTLMSFLVSGSYYF